MLLQSMLSEYSRVPYHMLILREVDIIDLVYVLCKVEEDVWVVLVVLVVSFSFLPSEMGVPVSHVSKHICPINYVKDE